MRTPGAWVLGHRAQVTRSDAGTAAVCSCGYVSLQTASLDNSCLSLVDHLQGAVRAGARVMRGDDGLAGVREPRRPLRPLGSADAALDAG